jgi:ferric-dicitrate binding protein FerR (iron transport regulator)
MEQTNQFDELLTGFLANELSTEQRKTAEYWINASRENYLYFESLKKAWELAETKRALEYVMDEMNVDDKWQHFKQVVTSGEPKIISLGNVKYEEDQAALEVPLRPLWKKYLVAVSIAASVLLIIGMGWNLLFPHKEKQEVAVEEKNVTPGYIERHVINTSGHDSTVLLPDHSSVLLARNSELVFRVPFVNSRNISLIGKGYFKVTKDKTRPFTVTSGAITTTALGTEFSITAFKNANKITVRLYEGKVVLKAVNRINPRMKKDVFLAPGQEYIYTNDRAGILRPFGVKSKQTAEDIRKEESPEDNPFIKDDKGSWYMFNNQSLAQVLDELAVLYNVKILYHKNDVRNIYFTGRYNQTDSVETILTRIAKLNKLKIVKNDSAFVISK